MEDAEVLPALKAASGFVIVGLSLCFVGWLLGFVVPSLAFFAWLFGVPIALLSIPIGLAVWLGSRSSNHPDG